ncbi:MAG: hypothetical protein HN348_22810 [Proteobacteria bacterium]|nr:hypothetical protein [Pseudomonadota bacterium]
MSIRQKWGLTSGETLDGTWLGLLSHLFEAHLGVIYHLFRELRRQNASIVLTDGEAPWGVPVDITPPRGCH